MEEDADAWVRFSEVGINARMRNALELFALKEKRDEAEASPRVCCGPGGNTLGRTAGLERLPAVGGLESTAGVTSAEDGATDGDEFRKIANG